MFTLSALIGVALITFIIGCVLGATLTRVLSPQQQKARSLESKLHDSEQKLTEYQQEVTEHFAQTAKLVNTLTQSYRDVHEHLSGDALKLANVDISRQLLKDSSNEDDKVLGDSALPESDFQPPKDWAPKTPGKEGTLSENFGLSDDDHHVTPHSTTENNAKVS
ncbi:MAG: YhcB family protein [Cellvibrionaceae bacterium]